jgi:hypothetical protein
MLQAPTARGVCLDDFLTVKLGMSFIIKKLINYFNTTWLVKSKQILFSSEKLNMHTHAYHSPNNYCHNPGM